MIASLVSSLDNEDKYVRGGTVAALEAIAQSGISAQLMSRTIAPLIDRPPGSKRAPHGSAKIIQTLEQQTGKALM